MKTAAMNYDNYAATGLYIESGETPAHMFQRGSSIADFRTHIYTRPCKCERGSIVDDYGDAGSVLLRNV